MKLSEAIRLGGMTIRQGRFRNSPDMPCALGGALQSTGKQPQDFQAINEIWPFISQPAKCPCGINHNRESQTWIGRFFFPAEDSVALVILCLNDDHGWTRNQIADWVETVEPADEQALIVESGHPMEQLEKK